MRLLRDVLVLITLVCSVVPSRAQSRDVQSADWSVQAKPSVVEMGFDKNAVAAFVNSLVGDPEDPLTANQIGDFKWLDVDKDGVYELLVTYDVTKRAFFGGPAIFKSIAGKKRWHQFLSGWELKELDGAIEDLDRDGLPELIVPIRLSEYRGARPIAVWPAVCKWNGDKFVDTSGQFRTFYEQRVLPEIEAEIRRLTAEAKQRQQTSLGYDEVMDERLAVAWMVRDKVARVTGEDPQAGVERVRAWVKSPNEYVRGKALSVIEDMKEEDFTVELQVLAADPVDQVLADSAKRELEQREKKKP